VTFNVVCAEVAEEEVGAPLCNCKLSQRHAVMKTVTRTGDANMGLRYWSCSNYRVPFLKKRNEPDEVEEESCKFFRFNLLNAVLLSSLFLSPIFTEVSPSPCVGSDFLAALETCI